MDDFGLKGSCGCQKPVRNKVILTKVVVWTVLDHVAPVHLPTVPRPLLMQPSSAARGAEQEGRNPAQGSRGFGAP